MFNQNEPPNSWSIDRIIELVKVAAIIAAGFWTVYLYWSNQRQRDDLTSQQLKLEIARAGLDNDRLAFESDTTKKSRELDAAGRFAFEYTLSFKDDQKGVLREVILAYGFKNNGDVPVVVRGVSIEWYAGSVSAKARNKALLNINFPPSTTAQDSGEHFENVGDPILWTKMEGNACTRDPFLRTRWEALGQNVIADGCGEETFLPGAEIANQDVTLVTSSKVALVGASIFVIYGPTGSSETTKSARGSFKRMFVLLPGRELSRSTILRNGTKTPFIITDGNCGNLAEIETRTWQRARRVESMGGQALTGIRSSGPPSSSDAGARTARSDGEYTVAHGNETEIQRDVTDERYINFRRASTE